MEGKSSSLDDGMRKWRKICCLTKLELKERSKECQRVDEEDCLVGAHLQAQEAHLGVGVDVAVDAEEEQHRQPRQ